MEQWRPRFEDGDEMKTRKRHASGVVRRAVNQVGVRLSRDNHEVIIERVAMGLVDLSVGERAGAELLKSRWQAEIQVRIPAYASIPRSLAVDIKGRLGGRQPLVFEQDGAVSVLFLVENSNDAQRGLVDEFAARLADFIGADISDVLLSRVTFFDTTEMDPYLSPGHKPEPYSPNS